MNNFYEYFGRLENFQFHIYGSISVHRTGLRATDCGQRAAGAVGAVQLHCKLLQNGNSVEAKSNHPGALDGPTQPPLFVASLGSQASKRGARRLMAGAPGAATDRYSNFLVERGAGERSPTWHFPRELKGRTTDILHQA